MAQASDEAIWDHAASVGAVIITKDEDFAARRPDLLRRLEAVLPAIELALERGETLIEIV